MVASLPPTASSHLTGQCISLHWASHVIASCYTPHHNAADNSFITLHCIAWALITVSLHSIVSHLAGSIWRLDNNLLDQHNRWSRVDAIMHQLMWDTQKIWAQDTTLQCNARPHQGWGKSKRWRVAHSRQEWVIVEALMEKCCELWYIARNLGFWYIARNLNLWYIARNLGLWYI